MEYIIERGKIIDDLPSGTREWADSNVNIAYGCTHDCRYCYAKKMAIRFHRATNSTWKYMRINEKAVKKRYSKRNGRIMFPSSHDITPNIISESLIVLKKLLSAGNEVLITTKPHLSCVKRICDELIDFREQMQFRFTIGSLDDKLLRFWEPGAPKFEERLESLKYAFDNGYRTSVSIEPFLDYDPEPLVHKLEPYISESIWIGKMNYVPTKNFTKFTPEERPFYKNIAEAIKEENIMRIYEKLKDHPLVRWKDSIKKILIKKGLSI